MLLVEKLIWRQKGNIYISILPAFSMYFNYLEWKLWEEMSIQWSTPILVAREFSALTNFGPI